MSELKFPVFKREMRPLPLMSSEEYCNFVVFNYRYLTNRKAYKEWKKKLAVNVRFKL